MNWLSVIPPVGILAILVTIFITWMNRRSNQLRFEIASKGMISASAVHEKISVTYGDEPVGNPHLVEVNFVNSGSKDVRPSDFAHDAPLIIDVNASVVAIIKDGSTEGSVKSSVSGNTIEIAPSLFRRNRQYTITAIVDGDPNSKFNVSKEIVADTNVSWSERTDDTEGGRGRGMRLSGIVATSAMTLALVANLVGIYKLTQKTNENSKQIDSTLIEQNRQLQEANKRNTELVEVLGRVLVEPAPR
ncbi:hypothetical protein [Nocardia sp. NPDC057440]|uniref:hypothetical protein n=1 Tax=Nocardia sp. NPDC057440 TaxID=3346134 RepID=UPI00366D4CEE